MHISYRPDQQEVSQSDFIQISCSEILKNKPTEQSAYLIEDFRHGKYFASRDLDEDGQWELVCVPCFPQELEKLESNYRSMIVCFKKVTDKSGLKEILSTGKIELYYWPARQQLDNDIHSRLAQKYVSMDFENCLIFHAGFDSPESMFGPATGKTSMVVGAIAGLAGIWNLLALIFGRIFRTSATDEPEEVVNRAGLPAMSWPQK